jgi:O-antigen ligase
MIAVAFSLPKYERPLSSKALGFGAVVFSAALVLSYSRASVLNIIVAIVVLWWLNRKRVPLGKIALGALTGALVVWRLFPSLAEQYWQRLSGSMQFFSSPGGAVLSGRAQSWETLLNWVTANPLQTFLGIGYKTLPYTQYLGAPVVADNMYLSLLVETGVAGLAALVWLNIAILRAARRATRAADPRRKFFGAWMLCFWSGQVIQMASGDLLTYWRVLPLYFWALAVAVRE